MLLFRVGISEVHIPFLKLKDVGVDGDVLVENLRQVISYGTLGK